VSELLQMIDLFFKFLDLLAFPFVILGLITFFVMLFAGRITLRRIREKDYWWARWFG
jgi:hypothetical protein